MSTKIIAEVGECFNGDMRIAHHMIQEAKTCGCDVVKFQLLDMEEVAKDDPEYDWFASLDLAPPRIGQLIQWCAEAEIEPLFTPVSIRTAQWVVDAGLKTVKIASSFVCKKELITYINTHFDIVYASTGMASLEEIDDLYNNLTNIKELKLLHCVSEYPTGPLLDERGLKALDEKDAHLNMMMILKERFADLSVGYSDHTDDALVPIVAVAMGAEIIEKHFTLNKKTPIANYNKGGKYLGTDHVLSVEPDKLRNMVDLIRRVERIKGDSEWKRSEGEQILMEFLRGRYQER